MHFVFHSRYNAIHIHVLFAHKTVMFSSPNANASLAETPGKSLLASSFKQPMFSTSRKKNTIHDEGCTTSKGSSFALRDENKFDPGGPNFSIYQEESNASDDRKESAVDGNGYGVSNGISFAIHEENAIEPGGLNFSIYQEESNESDDRKKSAAGGNGFGFAIHDENKQESGGLNFSIHQDDGDKYDPPAAEGNSGEDTASLSVIGNVFEEKSAPLFGIYSDSGNHPTSRSTNKAQHKVEAEDTASLSVIGDVMGSLGLGEPPQKPSSGFAIYSDEPHKEPSGFKIFAPENSPKVAKPGLGFEIFSDESAQKKQKVALNPPSFGDISRIEDEKTSNFQILDEHNAANTSSEFRPEAIDYEQRHKEDKESTMRKCLVAAKKSRSKYAIFDYRKKSMPKALLQKSFTSGTKIDLLGGSMLSIVNELGRGVFGVVVLCDDERGQSDAFKIEAPVGSLAHEYSLLLRLDDRVEPDTSGYYPFPRSRALYAFSEGGLFSMTAGSDSGMTLIDVVNTYKTITGTVPEMIAIYYTSRMLKYLELLHQSGRVLVSTELIHFCHTKYWRAITLFSRSISAIVLTAL